MEIICLRCDENSRMLKTSWLEDGTECEGYECPTCGFHIYTKPIKDDLKQYEKMGSIVIEQKVE
jgi:DNA-directed RNA polymerase subunit RPC12/RpoP